MKELPKVIISVIVPVYNVERYLYRCLESILSQEYQDFELLLINDGSTDISGRICDEYAVQDHRIKVFHQTHKGVSATRNFGLQQAKGEYVLFVDSDDWLEPNALKILGEYAIKGDYDIVGFDSFVAASEDTVVGLRYENIEDYRYDNISCVGATVWSKLTKKELYTKNNILFPNSISHQEDYVVSVMLVCYATNILFLPIPLYHYNTNNYDSICHTEDVNASYGKINAANMVIKFLQDRNLYEKYEELMIYRKWASKYALLRYHPFKWMITFPEVNKLIYEHHIGPRKLLVAQLLLLLLFPRYR